MQRNKMSCNGTLTISCVPLQSQIGENKPLPLQFLPAAVVDEVTHHSTRCTHVVEQLRFVIADQLADSFELDRNPTEHVQIGNVVRFELLSLVEDCKFLLPLEGNAAQRKLDLKALLVNLFSHSVAELVVNLECRTHQRVTLF